MFKGVIRKFSISIFGTSIVGVVVSFVITMTLMSAFSNEFVKVISLIISLSIYCVTLYSTAWHEGYRDPNRVVYGHARKFMAKGLVAGIWASIPYVVIYLLFLYSSLINSHKVLIGMVYRFFNAQYICMSNNVFDNPFLCAFFLLPMPVITAVGYILGYKQFSILGRILYKKKKYDKTQSYIKRI